MQISFPPHITSIYILYKATGSDFSKRLRIIQLHFSVLHVTDQSPCSSEKSFFFFFFFVALRTQQPF